MFEGFGRVAVLVKTRAGVLQITRHARERAGEVQDHPTFVDEAEAVAT